MLLYRLNTTASDKIGLRITTSFELHFFGMIVDMVNCKTGSWHKPVLRVNQWQGLALPGKCSRKDKSCLSFVKKKDNFDISLELVTVKYWKDLSFSHRAAPTCNTDFSARTNCLNFSTLIKTRTYDYILFQKAKLMSWQEASSLCKHSSVLLPCFPSRKELDEMIAILKFSRDIAFIDGIYIGLIFEQVCK